MDFEFALFSADLLERERQAWGKPGVMIKTFAYKSKTILNTFGRFPILKLKTMMTYEQFHVLRISGLYGFYIYSHWK